MPYEGSVYPMDFSTPRTTTGRSMYPLVVISPPTMHEAGGGEALTGNVGRGVLPQRLVQHRVRDLVAHLVRVAFPDALRCEDEVFSLAHETPSENGMVSKKLRRALGSRSWFFSTFLRGCNMPQIIPRDRRSEDGYYSRERR